MKKYLLVLCAILLMTLLVGCNQNNTTTDNNSSGTTTEATSQEKVLVYMSGSQGMINALETKFEETHGDVIDITILSCGQLRDKVWTESQSGEIEADIFFGSDPILFNKLDAEDKLLPLTLTGTDKIQSRFIVDDHDYALVVERYITVMTTNDTTRLANKPSSYSDLTNSEYSGKVGMADASLSATAFSIASSLYDLKGRNMDFFTDLNTNSVILSKSNGMVPSGILDGTYDVGIAPHDSFIRLNKKAKKDGYELNLELVWPSEGPIAIQRPIAVSKKADRSTEMTQICNDFVNFLLSKQGQTIQYNNGFVSVRTDIENTYLPTGVTVNQVDWEFAATNEATFKSAYDNIFKG